MVAVTDNFWLVVAAVVGAVIATLLTAWLSWLQERSRYRHAIRLVTTEFADNAAEIARYERKSISMDQLRERLSTELFDATRFELAYLQRRASGTWALVMDKYRGIRNTINTGSEPPSIESMQPLVEDLFEHWYVPWLLQFRLWRTMRASRSESGQN
jgi:hypothetical protein